MTDRRTALEKICRDQQVEILYVFGGRTQEVREWLDDQSVELSTSQLGFNISVKAPRNVWWSVDEKLKMTIALEGLLGNQRVDLVILNAADAFLAAEIIKGERLYTHNEYKADEYELYVLRRAGDLIEWNEKGARLFAQT